MAQEMSSAVDTAGRFGHESGYSFGYKAGIDENKDMIEKRALDMFVNQNWLVNPNHVFQVSKTGIPYLGMEAIKKDKLNNLQQQAKQILDSEIWPILTTLVRHKAIEKAVKESTEWEHVLPGKMMVYNISLLENLVKYIAEVDISKIPDASGSKDGVVH